MRPKNEDRIANNVDPDLGLQCLLRPRIITVFILVTGTLYKIGVASVGVISIHEISQFKRESFKLQSHHFFLCIAVGYIHRKIAQWYVH